MKDFAKKDAIAWQKFLTSESGVKGMLYLNSLCPSVQRSPNAHEMHFDAGKVEGFKQCLTAIDSIPDLKAQLDPLSEPDILER